MVKKVIVSIVLVLSVVLFSNCGYAEEKGLVGYWKLDESKGEITKDFSGNGNDGTIYGAVAVAGKIGQALSFDGVNDYVDCGSHSSLDMDTNDFTIEFWAKTIQVTDSEVVSKRGTGSYYMFRMKSGTIYFQMNDSHSNETIYRKICGCPDYNDGNWHHWVGVKGSGVEDLHVYKDGVELSGTYDFASSVGDISNSNAVTIGSRGGVSKWFNGTIDEVRIYKRALSTTEVKNHYKMESQAF